MTVALHFNAGSEMSVLRGLGFAHYACNATLTEGPAMVIGNAAGLTFEKNTFAYGSHRGLALFAPDGVIRDNNILYNGEGGIGGYKAHRSVIEGNYIGYNNTEHFKVG